MSDDKTLNEIIKKNRAISIFDGEFKIILGLSNGFQNSNEILSKKLLNILNLKDKNFIVGIINLPYKKNGRHLHKNIGIDFLININLRIQK